MRIDSLHFRLVLHFGGLFLLVFVGLTVYLDRSATAILNTAKSNELHGMASSSANLIARKLYEREREMSLLSQHYVLTQLPLPSAPLNNLLQRVQLSYPFYAWLGVVAPDGTVLAATGDMLLGNNVAQRPWFTAGLQGPYVGDVHEAVLLEKLLGKTGNEPLRFIDFAAPVAEADGRVRAVVAAHVNWNWIDDLASTARSDSAPDTSIEFLILSQQGQWLHPFEHVARLPVPANLPTPGTVALVDWPDGGRFVTARVTVSSDVSEGGNALGWQVVLRQPLQAALQPVAELNKQLFIFCAVALLLGTLLAYWLASLFSRPIEQLSDAAQRIAQGQEHIDFATGSSLNELRQLSKALRSMMTNLALKRLDMEHANENLEREVAMRTADLERANKALQQLSRRDPLTGIANRRAADEQLHSLFGLLQRGSQPYAVLLIDIDHFKRINDNFGHETGDRVIQRIATVLQSQLRDTDLVARYGGEEFIVLLPNTPKTGALAIANKLCSTIAADTIPPVGQLTVSVGVAPASTADSDAEQAVRQADIAMYRAKRGGRNRVLMAEADTAAPSTES